MSRPKKRFVNRFDRRIFSSPKGDRDKRFKKFFGCSRRYPQRFKDAQPALEPFRGSISTRSLRIFAAVNAERVSTRFSRSEEHTSELQSIKRLSYAVLCLK